MEETDWLCWSASSIRHALTHNVVYELTSGVSAGQIIPHKVLWSCLGLASLPSRPIGLFNLRKWDRVEANVSRFSTCNVIIQLRFPPQPDSILEYKLIWYMYIIVDSLFHTWDTPALAWWAFFWSPQLPVAREYFSPSVIILVFIESSRLKSLPLSINFWAYSRTS